MFPSAVVFLRVKKGDSRKAGYAVVATTCALYKNRSISIKDRKPASRA